MEEQDQSTSKGNWTFSYTMRDFVSVGFRRRGLIVLSFLGIFLGAAVYAWFLPRQYEAQIKILLNRERVDPLVSSEGDVTPKQLNTSVSEQEQNSEVELLKSRDLLRKVVIASQLNQQPGTDSWWSRLPFLGRTLASGRKERARVGDKATSTIADALLQRFQVQPVSKSNIILVTFRDSDPVRAAQLLNVFADLYLERHLAVHRPAGTLEFFQQETERYRKGLVAIEAQLSNFGQTEGVASLQIEKETTLQKLSDFEAKLRETNAAIAETQQRIRAMELQMESTPPRLVSTVRTSENREIVQSLKSTLLTLELKRTEMLGKYEPSYRPVQELDKQITQIRSSLAAEEAVSHRDESTDRNPAYDRLKEDLAKARAELPALQARSANLMKDVSAYRERGSQLFQKEMAQNDLTRSQKIADANYQLYFHKQEEARISDALDKQRILNVSVIEKAGVPSQPVSLSRSLILIIASVLAIMVSVGLAFAMDLLDPSFRTPDELKTYLNIPVLAAIPRSA
jgi:uncharacterized protein involved in exopolysaccharide biosynthesis